MIQLKAQHLPIPNITPSTSVDGLPRGGVAGLPSTRCVVPLGQVVLERGYMTGK